MRSLVFSVATTPRGWQRTGAARGRGNRKVTHYTRPATRIAEAEIRWAFKQAYPRLQPHEGPVALSILATFVPPASWPKWKRALAMAGLWRPTGKPDWDNIGKLVGDALNGFAYVDDAQVYDGRVRCEYGSEPRLLVRLSLQDQPEREAVSS